jgi:beta-lactamase regulating signal transducer with metallopeptidase domain
MALIWVVESAGVRERIGTANVPPQLGFVITTSTANLPQKKPTVDTINQPAAPAIAPVSPPVKWPGWIWLAGTAFLFARFLAGRLWLALRRFRALSIDEKLGEVAAALGLKNVRIQIWPGLRNPVAFGTLRPAIAVPADFRSRFSENEQQAVLAHEMAHLSARDPFWMAVVEVVVALAWWHPLLWLAKWRFQTRCESAADEACALVPNGAPALAECLVRIGRELTDTSPERVLGVDGNGPKSQLAVRVKKLLRTPPAWQPISKSSRWVPHLSALTAVGATFLLPLQTGIPSAALAFFSVGPRVQAEKVLSTNSPTAPAVSFTEKPPYPTSITYQWVVGGTNNPQLRLVEEPRQVRLQVRLVSIPENETEEVGLDWIFGVAPTNNPQTEISHDWNSLPGSFVSTNKVHPRNVTIESLRTEGQSAVLNPRQFSALLDRVRASKADILTAPSTLANSGLQTEVASQEITTIVTGVETSPPSSTKPFVNFLTDQFAGGFSVDIVPRAKEGDEWELTVQAGLTSFLGYEKPGSVSSISAPGAEAPIQYENPLPHFRKLEALATGTVPLGSTLAIRGPLWSKEVKSKIHFSQPSKSNLTGQRAYIFITPVAPQGVTR